MPRNKLFQAAGWCALATVALFVAAVVALATGAVLAGVTLEYLSFLPLALVLYALFVVHQSESKALGVAALILLCLAIGADVVANTHYGVTFLSSLWYLLFALPFLIFGLLGYRSPRMPRGPAVMALLTGVAWGVAASAGFLGRGPLGDNLSLVAILAMLAWLVWLRRVFASQELAAAR